MKKKILPFLFCFITATFYSFSVSAQFADTTIARYAKDYQPEKTYLHYDKASYYPGETIWFKGYLMEGILPAEGSKTFYADWIGDNGEVLYHSVCPVVDAACSGQFDIPADYKGNFIHVRAYTRWMLNFDTSFLYSKDIRILSKTPVAAKSRPAIIPSIQFFPEGGDVVAGVANRIAFEAADQWGRPVRVRGVVVNNKGAVVDSFRAVHDGMGLFTLVAKDGETYTAKWKDEKGAEHTTALPTIRSSGFSMQLGITGTKRILSLNGAPNMPDNVKTVHLVGTMNQNIAFKTDAVLTPGGNVRKVIPTEALPSGILVITVFDAGWNAIAERVTFINNHDYLFAPSMEVSHWGLNKRAKNEIEISVPDSLTANLSVAVTDAGIERDTSDNIISHLLLTADIKGYVHNPAYYFSSDADSVVQNLDLVMMTHGWRRFKWEDVAKGKYPAINFPKDTGYLSLSGKVFGVAKSQLSGNDNIFLFVKGKDTATQLVIVPIKPNGTFNEPDAVFFDTLHVYYQLKSKFFSQAEARFMPDRLPAPNYSAFSKSFAQANPYFSDTAGSYRHMMFGAESARLLANAQKNSVLETVTVKAKAKSATEQMDEKYASGLFKGGDGYNFNLVDDPASTSYQNIFTYLQGKVAGLQITTGAGSTSLSWRGSTPTIFLDEVPVDVDMISTIPVTDVAYVKVLRPPFIGAPGGGAGGAIAVYTRKGNDVKSAPGKGMNSSVIAGYTPYKQFYSPNYERFDPRNDQQDIRTTLYWNPLVSTSVKNHKVKLTFFNNDISQSFRVVIEGVTKEGLLAHYEQIME